jgi:hypothetical protein
VYCLKLYICQKSRSYVVFGSVGDLLLLLMLLLLLLLTLFIVIVIVVLCL